MIVQHPQPTDQAQICPLTLPHSCATKAFYITQSAEHSLTCYDAKPHVARLGSQLAFQRSVTLC